MKYHQTPVETKTILEQIVETLSRHNLPINPVNFSVLYQFFSNINSALIEHLEDKAQTDQWDEYVLEFAYEHFVKEPRHFSSENFSQLTNTVTSMNDASKQAQSSVNLLDEQLAHANQHEQCESSTLTQFSVSVEKIKADQAQLCAFVEQAQKQTKKIQAELEQAKLEALTDNLTGLKNRKGLDNFFIENVKEKATTTLAALVVDIDHFKSFNDNFGHLVGDLILRRLARMIATITDDLGEVFRFGGEEFVVLLPNADRPTAATLAESIRMQISKVRFRHTRTNEALPKITVSLGVTSYQKSDDLSSLLERADQALYQAKREGRNKVSIA